MSSTYWPFFVLAISVAFIIVGISKLRLHAFLALVLAQTTGAITWQHGPATNRLTFTASNCAFDTPSLQEMEAITMITLPFRPLPTSAGNNEWSLALT